jgi:hypothetical protein
MLNKAQKKPCQHLEHFSLEFSYQKKIWVTFTKFEEKVYAKKVTKFPDYRPIVLPRDWSGGFFWGDVWSILAGFLVVVLS